MTGTAGAPQTLEEAKVAASKLGAFLADKFQAWRDAGGHLAPPDTMTKVFGPRLEGLPPETATLGLHSIVGDFFYAVTAIDLESGNVFQTGPGSLRPFYGPLTPPAEARITGAFTESELYELETAVREGLHAADLAE